MTIQTRTLKRIFDALLEHLDNTGRSTITIEQDYYHTIAAGDFFVSLAHDKEPEVVIGQLTDDLEFLADMLSSEGDTLGHGFVRLASILHAIGAVHPW